jgi:hypothetical protein
MGWVQLGSIYALGTGTAVPRSRSRIDSSGAYGQNVIGVSTIGIGAPRAYDWDIYDGTLNFEITKDIFLALKAWVLARASQTTITFSTRKDNEQSFVDTLWNSISISASEGALLDGSLGFTAMDRASYAYGFQGIQGYYDNKVGAGLLCPLAAGMPAPLNSLNTNYNPIPFWDSKVTLGADVYDFLSWTLDFSQEVVKFFGCTNEASPQAPLYMGVGPMTVTLSGAFMWLDPTMPATFPADSIATAKVDVADVSMSFAKLELNTSSDDVQAPDSTVPVNVEYSIYELSAS